jgi:hypothetical protein
MRIDDASSLLKRPTLTRARTGSDARRLIRKHTEGRERLPWVAAAARPIIRAARFLVFPFFIVA